MSSWHDLQSARADWADARKLTDPTLGDVLELAKDACWFYDHPRQVVNDLGVLVDAAVPDDVPVRYRVAQLMQAIAAWQLPRTGDQGGVGLDGYAGRVYVFGYDIRTIIHPPVYGEQVG